MPNRSDPQERLRRWRLVLGRDAQSDPAAGIDGLDVRLHGDDDQMDKVLQALYDSERKAGLGSSCPNVNRWLGDIRSYFPSSVVQIMQRDALQRLKLHRMLLEKETLEAVEPDVHLVGTLLSLKSVIPSKTRQTARQLVRRVVDDLQRRLRNPLAEAVRGALTKASRTNRPKGNEIDWDRTIRRNLKNYLPEKKTIIAERLVGYGRRRPSLRDVILCVDQSGSMATSVVYSSVFAAVLASLRSVKTRMVVFDTEVVDLTDFLHDPVELLFGTQLGGGTDINRAVAFCQSHITRPLHTLFVLVSDLFEGGNAAELVQRVGRMVSSGVTCVCLLALSDEGSPVSDEGLAAELAAVGVPCFACTPDLFPSLMAAAIRKQDLRRWAGAHDVVAKGGNR